MSRKKRTWNIAGIKFKAAPNSDVSRNPWSLSLDQCPIEGGICLPQHGRADDRSDKKERRPDNKPAGEPIYRLGLIEPPRLFLDRLLLFCAPGFCCGLAGFIFLFGPHRRPTLGAALFFAGLLVVAAGAALAVG
jgi:hypothetical protein